MALVYFIQAGDGGLIKIGLAADLTSRLAQLQTACPQKLKPLGVIQTDDASAVERQLHARFAEHRERGEWFRPDQAIIEYVRDHAERPLEHLRGQAAAEWALARCEELCDEWKRSRRKGAKGGGITGRVF